MFSKVLRQAFFNNNIALYRNGKGLKTIIIGGVAGGASAAARLRRLDESAKIMMIEMGPYVSFANCGLPYYVSGVIKERSNLIVQTPQSLNDRFNIDIRIETQVLKINREKKEVELKNLKTKEIYTESYDKLILSPGAEPIKPPIPGINSERVYVLRTIPDSDKIKQIVTETKPKHAVVVGGGFIGLEMAENLHHAGINVSIVEMSDQVMGPIDYEMAALVHQHIKIHNVELLLKDGVKEFKQQGNKVNVKLSSGKVIETDLVIFSIGVKCEVKLAKEAGLDVKRGIITNEKLQTSDPDIYALGDAIEVKDFVSGDNTIIPLAGPANKQGRIVADQIVGRENSIYKGTQGTGIVKVFDLTVASTGLNEKILKAKKIPYIQTVTHNHSHASYYPGSSWIAVKVIFSPEDGKILGSQVIGPDGVDKRIDVLATALRNKNTVFDLEELELAYAPPFSSAKDPVNYAGFTSANILKKDSQTVNWDQLEQWRKNNEDIFLLDARFPKEYEQGTIPGSVNIPLDTIRQNFDKIPKDKKIVTYCQGGLRGYIAYRVLVQNGYEQVYNLNGGFKTWNHVILNQNNEIQFNQKQKQINKQQALNSFYAFWAKDFGQLIPNKQ